MTERSLETGTSETGAPVMASAAAADAGVSGAGGRPARRFQFISRGGLWRLGIGLGAIVCLAVIGYRVMIWMPGAAHSGALPALTAAEAETAEYLRRHVTALASEVGQRSTFRPRGMAAAAHAIMEEMARLGYGPAREVFADRGTGVPNLEYTLGGTTRAGEIVLVGAHFDTFQGTPGADDNASGCAALLALAKEFAGQARARTLRFAFFVNEEPPAFWTEQMGSWVYAKACRARGDVITAMISLETLGYYSDAPGSQRYPTPLNWCYSDRGNFVAIVGSVGSRELTRRAVEVFRRTTAFPAEGAALPSALPGVGWSDHWSFWQEGYPAIMLTDTAPYRNPNYHKASDTPETLDYERFARVVGGTKRVVEALASDGSDGR